MDKHEGVIIISKWLDFNNTVDIVAIVFSLLLFFLFFFFFSTTTNEHRLGDWIEIRNSLQNFREKSLETKPCNTRGGRAYRIQHAGEDWKNRVVERREERRTTGNPPLPGTIRRFIIKTGCLEASVVQIKPANIWIFYFRTARARERERESTGAFCYLFAGRRV